MKSDLVDVTMHMHHETAKAILVSDDGVKGNAVWIPKSHCETEALKDGAVIVTLPAWVAREKGLI